MDNFIAFCFTDYIVYQHVMLNWFSMKRRCSKCDGLIDRQDARYCVACHRAYMRIWRLGQGMTELQRNKDTARSYANVYQKRGKLLKRPCDECGDPNVQKHHEDYDKPLDVKWLCAHCHQRHHRLERSSGLDNALNAFKEAVVEKCSVRGNI